MCFVCLEWEKGKLNITEASWNLKEMALYATPEEIAHYQQTMDRIVDETIAKFDTEDDI